MLKCGVMEHGNYFPWFVNDYDHENDDNHIFFANQESIPDDAECWDVDGEFAGYMPNVPMVAYHVDYNEYYDDPFSVVRDDDFMVYSPNTFRANPKTSAKFPALVRFASMDTFDRMGSIKGNSLEIISLADVEDGKIMFV